MSSQSFAPSSRYYLIETRTIELPDGRTVAYLKRRFVPQPERFQTVQEHVDSEGDRLDNIAAAYLTDPQQYWRLCDANAAMRPAELTDTAGERIRITLPEGVAASSSLE
jgi:hypothetical protein